jgi:hypothetical protein
MKTDAVDAGVGLSLCTSQLVSRESYPQVKSTMKMMPVNIGKRLDISEDDIHKRP